MKKFHLLLVTIVLLLILSIIVSIDFNRPNTIEEALEKVNVNIDKIYFIDNFDNITIAFYKEKISGHQTVGVFSNQKGRFSFIIQQDLQWNLNANEEITFNTVMHDKTNGIPEYSLQFGIINNPQIENIILHMSGEAYLEDRHAEIIQLDGLRVWYTYLDTKRIFIIQQGLSKDGKVIYTNSKIYD